MRFRPGAVQLTAADGDNGSGVVSYRLARQQVISEFQKGRLSQLDICDAHPELRRAAVGAGQPIGEPCPICEDDTLALVTYAFGPRLPAGGRCITTAREMTRLRRRKDQITCYVVEVCPDCGWNHLNRVFHVGGHT